jgi:hypothetical protein
MRAVGCGTGSDPICERLWRTVMRRKYQITRNRVQLHNRLEALLAHIKVSSIVSDLLGISARRMLQALADGETDPTALAALAAPRLRATPSQLCDAFQGTPRPRLPRRARRTLFDGLSDFRPWLVREAEIQRSLDPSAPRIAPVAPPIAPATKCDSR